MRVQFVAGQQIKCKVAKQLEPFLMVKDLDRCHSSGYIHNIMYVRCLWEWTPTLRIDANCRAVI